VDIPEGALTISELSVIFQHRGFGRPMGTIWFIGVEEGGEPTIDELKLRATFPPIMGLQGAHELFNSSMRNSGTQTWLYMARIVKCIDNEIGWDDDELAWGYAESALGHPNGDTFLAELLPLPKPGYSAWPYGALVGSNQRTYRRTMFPQRLLLLHSLLNESHPRAVVCYGKRFSSKFQVLFPSVNFTRTPGHPFDIGSWEGVPVAVTKFLSDRHWHNNLEHVRVLADKLRA
jgi:hypothetical protein